MQIYIRDMYDDAIRTGHDPAAIICHLDDVGIIAKLLHFESIPIDCIIATDFEERGGFGLCESRSGELEDEINNKGCYRLITLVLPLDEL